MGAALYKRHAYAIRTYINFTFCHHTATTVTIINPRFCGARLKAHLNIYVSLNKYI